MEFIPLYLIFLLCQPPCPDGMLIVGWSSSIPQIEAKETLDSVPIELCLYSRPVVVATLLVPARPDALPLSPSSHVYILLSWVTSIKNAPTSPHPVPRACALPFPCRPSGSARCWGCPPRRCQWTFTALPSPTGSIQCLAGRPQLFPAGRLGAPAPGVSLLDCADGSTWKLWGGWRGGRSR